MKISEIIKLPATSGKQFELPQNVIDQAKMIGKSEHREVFSSSFISDGDTLFAFFNKDEKGIAAFIVVEEDKIVDKEVVVIKRTWTRNDLQRKGYLSGLLRYMIKHVGLAVVSDSEQTPSARSFWMGIGNKFNVNVINVSNGQILSRNDVDDSELYSDNQIDPTEYRLIAEARDKKIIKEWFDPILTPYCYFEDGDV